MMKVGIVTFTESTNYGQRLQNYAVSNYLQSLGFETETILLNRDFLIGLKLRCILKTKILLKHTDWPKCKRMLRFDKFNQKYITFSKNGYAHGEKYDYVVCGSDQIWNLKYNHVRSNLDYFFGGFVEPRKRISFSASIGVENLSDEQCTILAERVEAMKGVSVREKAAENLIRNLTNRDVQTTLDPVFMMNKEDWNKIAKRPAYIKEGEKYILTYFLGEVDDFTKKYIQQIAKETNCRLIQLSGESSDVYGDPDIFMTDPAEFVWLISNSELVLTDSFHGCAFSCIYHTPLRWFSRRGGAAMNSRIENIFSLFSMTDWAVGNNSQSADEIMLCDYSGYDSVIESEQAKVKRFLQSNLK